MSVEELPTSSAGTRPRPAAAAQTSAAPGVSGAGTGPARALAVAFFVIYAIYSCSRYTQFRSAGYDLGIFDQAVRHYAHFHAPTVSLKGYGFDLLGDHFHPILVLLAPLYWIWADPRMLLIAQAALVAWSVLPVFRFTRRHLGPRAALAIVVAYGLSWPIQALINFDFHEVAFAVPLIAVVIDALDRKSYRHVVVACAVLLLVREDMGMFVAVVALLLAFRRRYMLAAALGVLGVGGYFLATAWVIPTLSPTHSFAYWSYGALGPDVPSVLWTSVSRPWRVITTFFTPGRKSVTLLLLIGPTLGLSCGSTYVLLAAPFAAERFLSDRSMLWGTRYQYSAVFAPILVMAAVATLARLWPRLAIARGRYVGAISGRRVVAVLVLVPVIGTLAVQQPFPLKRFFTGAAFQHTTRMSDIAAALRLVPTHVCVEGDDRMLAHLTGRDTVTPISYAHGLATWLLVDTSVTQTGWEQPTPQDALAGAATQGFAVAYHHGDIWALHRNATVASVCSARVS